jgi:hypothetical protein
MAFPYIFPGMYSFPPPPAVAGGSIHGMPIIGGGLNHAPLELGDSLPVPTQPNQLQTWWGFPTWRETMTAAWADPVWTLNANGGNQARGISPAANFTALTPGTSWYEDPSVGSSTFVAPPIVWQDDLILSNVRSFDVKAYEPNITTANLQVIGSGYVDLGYLNLVGGFVNRAQANVLLQTFGHEGRIPPFGNPSAAGNRDFRFNPQVPTWSVDDPGGAGAETIRLRRVYDTWSTTYTTAPTYSWVNLASGQIFGTGAPLYPSYPPPYPIPLRGIQIQIRVTDPSTTRVKTLTIRQDFTDKL